MKQLIVKTVGIVTLTTVGIVAAATALGAEVSCASHVAKFDETRKGALVSLKTKAGVEFSTARTDALWTVTARQVGSVTNSATVTANEARSFRCEKTKDGVRFVYGDFGERPFREVVCTIRGNPTDKRLRWRISAVAKEGWAVCEMVYPQLALTGQIGASGEDDAILTGASFSNGLRQQPLEKGFLVDCTQPGYLAVQMVTYYDPKALLLFACEDGNGEAKRLHGWSEKRNKRIQMRWNWRGWGVGRADLPYDIVTATIDDPSGELTWHDGADLYKEWAINQRWCKTIWKNRADIPAWLHGKAAYADMGGGYRQWIDRPGSLVEWSRDYFQKLLPGAKIAVHFDGWERNGIYNMTHYFPLYPTDADYRAFATEAYKYGFLAFPWPSGTRRADAFNKLPDGSFSVDEREAFDRDFLPHACKLVNGERQLCGCSWLNGGKVSYMCPGDRWTLDWFANDICGELAKRGTPCVSGDQNIGGAAAPCWSLTHGHTPGSGRWMTESAREMAIASVAAIRKYYPEASFCYEEPNEQINDVVTFNNVREAWKPQVTWSGLFNYLYHEFAPIFPLGGKGTYGEAYQMAMGLMPHVRINFGDINHTSTIMPNGGFEESYLNGTASAWENGVRQEPNGVDTTEFHSGKRSMRIERDNTTNRWVHVAVNLACNDSAFTPGRKYRISAWMKTGKGSFQMDCGIFGEKGSLAWTRLQSGKAGEGWKKVSADFVYPKGNVTMFRLMMNAGKGTVGWLDDVTLERFMDDGSLQTLKYEGSRERDEWQKRTVNLWAGEGQPYLAYGRRVKPPKLDCAKIEYFGRTVEAVCVGAYVSPEGKKALVFANGTKEDQKVAWNEKGQRRELNLAPREIKIVE